MKRWFFLVPVALFGVLWLHPIPALAGLHICNKTQHRVYVAVGTVYGDCQTEDCTMHSQGWWNIDPGGCKTPIGDTLDTSGDTYYYYYAEDSNGATWTGPMSFCIDSENKFDYGDGEQSNCAGTHKSFRHIDIGGSADYTLSLTP